MRWNGIDVAFIPSLIHQGFERVCLELFSVASSSKLEGWDTLSWLIYLDVMICGCNFCVWMQMVGIWKWIDLKDLNKHLASNAES